MSQLSDVDDIFNEFACAFVGTIRADREVAFPSRLPRRQLDGSVDSLKVVDRYLAYVHKHRSRVPAPEWHTTVLWAGAYVGEVIRHAGGSDFRWLDYNDYMPAHPELKVLLPERTTATCGLLVRASGAMIMPLNKVARFIEEGPVNSVHFFAVCDLERRWVNGCH
jgi:hypothetical protein